VGELPDYVLRNREAWSVMAADFVAAGERNWATAEPNWGVWGVPESELRLLPDDLDGRDAIELGCGTGYVSAWMARRGARVVGIDNSEVQLDTARRLQQEHGIEFPLIHGNAETVPLPDESFDFAISEYGVCIWADPAKWVPEAARLLRPGGRLVFLMNSHLFDLTVPDEDGLPSGEKLLRPAFGMYRMEWPDDPGVEFHQMHGEWIRLLRRSGFEIEDLIEIQAPEGATTTYPYFDYEWARRWPTEEVWKTSKKG